MDVDFESGLVIDKIREESIPEIIQLQSDCKLSPWTEEAYRREIGRDDSIQLAAIYENKVIGFIVMRILSTDAEIHNIAVRRQYSKMGIGKRLLDKAVQRAILYQGVEQIWLEVRESNQNAIGFYQKNGFIVTGERKKFYSNPTEDALLMVLEVKSFRQML